MSDFDPRDPKKRYDELKARYDAGEGQWARSGLPKRMSGCDHLLADAVDCEVTPFYQFILLEGVREQPGRPKVTQYAGLPPWVQIAKDGRATARLRNRFKRWNGQLDQLAKIHPQQPPAGADDDRPAVDRSAALDPVDARTALLLGAYSGRKAKAMHRRWARYPMAFTHGNRVVHKPLPPALKPRPQGTVDLTPFVRFGQDIYQTLGTTGTGSSMDVETATRPLWAVGIEFEQSWCSEGYRRGRLVRSVPLTPGEQLEIQVKTWDRNTVKRTMVESIEQNLSTELVGDEKWTLAVNMNTVNQMNIGANANAGANAGVSVPVKVVSVELGGEVGIAGQISSGLTNTVENSNEFIQSTTLKSANSLKTARTNTVEIGREIGEETETKQIITNANKCNTLTYHYFEVVEDFIVTSKPVDADFFLLAPLPVPTQAQIKSPEWILSHECLLRKMLPCDDYYAGFDGAKELLVHQALATAPPPPAAGNDPGNSGNDGGGSDDAPSAIEAQVATTLDLYESLSTASLLATGGSASELDDAIGKGVGALISQGKQVVDNVASAAQAGAKNVGDMVSDAADTVTGVLGRIGEAVEDLPNPMSLLQFSTAPGFQIQARTAAVPEGGPGSWLYWEVAQIAAPEIGDALLELEAGWTDMAHLTGGARQNAERLLLSTFFGQIGDARQAFGKVDAAVGVLMGLMGVGTTSAATAAGAAIGSLITPGYGTAIGAGIGLGVGTAVVGGVTALAASLEAMGVADLIPDDLGLKDSVIRLEAAFRSSLALTMAAGSPAGEGGVSGDEAISVIDRRIERQRAEARDYARAQVEFNRLTDHISDNIRYYAQAFWNQMTDYDIYELVRDNGIPPEVVEHNFRGFFGTRGALRVVDTEWVKANGGPDWEAEREKIVAAKTRSAELMTLPTAGVTVEPAIGQCDACDTFVKDHRNLDLANRKAEVTAASARARQEALEAARYERRIQAGQLGDPTPFEGGNTTVEVTGNTTPDE